MQNGVYSILYTCWFSNMSWQWGKECALFIVSKLSKRFLQIIRGWLGLRIVACHSRQGWPYALHTWCLFDWPEQLAVIFAQFHDELAHVCTCTFSTVGPRGHNVTQHFHIFTGLCISGRSRKFIGKLLMEISTSKMVYWVYNLNGNNQTSLE